MGLPWWAMVDMGMMDAMVELNFISMWPELTSAASQLRLHFTSM
jgi:hypothetical protein